MALALFFVLLARGDRNSYLRDWTFAWIAQVGALALMLAGHDGWPLAPGLYLVLAALHGVLLCAAAQRYALGSGLRARVFIALGPVAVLALVSNRIFDEPRLLNAAVCGILAATHVLAARLLWPSRGTTAMGLRLVTNLLLILSALYATHAALYAAPMATDTLAQHDYESVAPFSNLVLQMLLALGMVLAAMEAGQRELAGANSELEEAKRRLKMLADTDPMTGCFNRRVFRDLVDEVRADPARRFGTVLVLDMDGLKALNDSQGHSAGDQAIRRTADAIRSHTREGDLVVRWGGDEFVVILSGAARDEACRRANGISAAIIELGLGASVGLSAYGTERDIVSAVREADREMYEVKAARKAQAAPAAP